MAQMKSLFERLRHERDEELRRAEASRQRHLYWARELRGAELLEAERRCPELFGLDPRKEALMDC